MSQDLKAEIWALLKSRVQVVRVLWKTHIWSSLKDEKIEKEVREIMAELCNKILTRADKLGCISLKNAPQGISVEFSFIPPSVIKEVAEILEVENEN